MLQHQINCDEDPSSFQMVKTDTKEESANYYRDKYAELYGSSTDPQLIAKSKNSNKSESLATTITEVAD